MQQNPSQLSIYSSYELPNTSQKQNQAYMNTVSSLAFARSQQFDHRNFHLQTGSPERLQNTSLFGETQQKQFYSSQFFRQQQTFSLQDLLNWQKVVSFMSLQTREQKVIINAKLKHIQQLQIQVKQKKKTIQLRKNKYQTYVKKYKSNIQNKRISQSKEKQRFKKLVGQYQQMKLKLKMKIPEQRQIRTQKRHRSEAKKPKVIIYLPYQPIHNRHAYPSQNYHRNPQEMGPAIGQRNHSGSHNNLVKLKTNYKSIDVQRSKHDSQAPYYQDQQKMQHSQQSRQKITSIMAISQQKPQQTLFDILGQQMRKQERQKNNPSILIPPVAFKNQSNPLTLLQANSSNMMSPQPSKKIQSHQNQNNFNIPQQSGLPADAIEMMRYAFLTDFSQMQQSLKPETNKNQQPNLDYFKNDDQHQNKLNPAVQQNKISPQVAQKQQEQDNQLHEIVDMINKSTSKINNDQTEELPEITQHSQLKSKQKNLLDVKELTNQQTIKSEMGVKLTDSHFADENDWANVNLNEKSRSRVSISIEDSDRSRSLSSDKKISNSPRNHEQMQESPIKIIVSGLSPQSGSDQKSPLSKSFRSKSRQKKIVQYPQLKEIQEKRQKDLYESKGTLQFDNIDELSLEKSNYNSQKEGNSQLAMRKSKQNAKNDGRQNILQSNKGNKQKKVKEKQAMAFSSQVNQDDFGDLLMVSRNSSKAHLQKSTSKETLTHISSKNEETQKVAEISTLGLDSLIPKKIPEYEKVETKVLKQQSKKINQKSQSVVLFKNGLHGNNDIKANQVKIEQKGADNFLDSINLTKVSKISQKTIYQTPKQPIPSTKQVKVQEDPQDVMFEIKLSTQSRISRLKYNSTNPPKRQHIQISKLQPSTMHKSSPLQIEETKQIDLQDQMDLIDSSLRLSTQSRFVKKGASKVESPNKKENESQKNSEKKLAPQQLIIKEEDQEQQNQSQVPKK